jgi:hypothetical protein
MRRSYVTQSERGYRLRMACLGMLVIAVGVTCVDLLLAGHTSAIDTAALDLSFFPFPQFPGSGAVTVTNSNGNSVTVAPQTSPFSSYNFNLPTTAGAAGSLLTSQGGSSSAMTWTSLAFVTLTDGGTITWAISSAPDANATVTLGGNRTLAVTNPLNGGQ